MKKVLAIVIVLIGLALGFFVIPSVVARNSPEEILNKLQSGDENAVTDKLSSIAEMSVIEYDYKNAVKLKDTEKLFKKIKVPFSSKQIVMIYDGKIKLGADVQKIDADVDKDSDGKITAVKVVLPPVKITSSEIDRDSFVFPVEKASIINQLSSKDYDELEKKAKKEIEKKVKNSAAMTTANSELQKSIKGFLEGLYGDKVNITFTQE